MVKKRSKNARPSYHDKTEIVMTAVRRLVYEQKLRGGGDYGFTMAQIAEEAGYSRSQRFMETLYSMCDDGLLQKQEWQSGNPHIPNRIWFRLPASVKQQSFTSSIS